MFEHSISFHVEDLITICVMVLYLLHEEGEFYRFVMHKISFTRVSRNAQKWQSLLTFTAKCGVPNNQ